MSIQLSNEKNELVNQIAKKEGLKNFKVTITSGSTKGDGYLGIIKTINLEDESAKKLHLVMKSASAEEKLRELEPVKKAYEREIFLYDTIFPEFKKLSEEFGIKDQFTETAKYYGSILTDKEECLVLENLKELNFKLWNRKVPMNEEHLSFVFSTYAKFHAAGTALKLLKPERFEEFKKNMKYIFYEEEKDNTQETAEKFKHIFSTGYAAVSNDEKATQKLNNFAANAESFLKNIHVTVDPYCTFLHGDCWCNNMMFKYNSDENPLKPAQMCFLDWQVSFVGSPILDLSYFFYSCSSKDALYKLDYFLKIYYERFSRVLQQAGLVPEKVISYEELKHQWKKYSKFGLFMVLIVMKVVLSEVSEAPDMAELAKEGKDIIQSVHDTNSVNMDAINQRIADVILFMVENDYL